ncbi:putative zinc finger protein PLAGL1 [Penaeus vannamei]|uniref:Putative zinc finger protein PLAGL1 n=1 Tax=Penaeus vannamei TaxID=6689 RepID=A0A3R7N446_PENVA|nr:putative zinc finger protein PLAGL1 [Penaeus vannamei]
MERERVYARQLLTKRLQFGPLQAEKIFAGSQQVAVEEEIKERFGIVFKITQEEGDYLLLDTQQEERSNWMIFVRPAERKSEQNLVAFQYKGDIYFATIKEIPAQCELKVWFSKDYAERMGTRILADFVVVGCEVVFSSRRSLSNHRCSRAQITQKGETPATRGKQVKKSTRREASSQPTPTPSTSVRGQAPQVEPPTSQPEKAKTSVKEELKSPASTSESEESEVFSLSPERRSPRSSPRGRGSGYTCTVCQKLVRHQLIHTTERQHQCPSCERSFHRKDHLKNHIQIHDPNKQFKCDEGLIKFGRKDHLVRHIKKSHGILDISRMEGLELSATPGSSSAPQAPSPSASVASSPPTSEHQQLPMQVFQVLQGLGAGVSQSFITSHFQQEFRLFEESIKEEPELQPSVEEIGPGGDDLSKMLGMYFPSGSINLSGTSLLEARRPQRAEVESQRSLLESALLRMPPDDQKETVMLGQEESFSRESLHTRSLFSGSQSGDFSQEGMMSAELLSGDSSGVSGRSVHSPATPLAQPQGSEIPAVTTAATTTSAAVTTTASLLPSLPGFDQVFP